MAKTIEVVPQDTCPIRKVIKKYDDGCVFILKVSDNTVDFFENNEFFFTMINVGKINSFINSDSCYEAAKRGKCEAKIDKIKFICD